METMDAPLPTWWWRRRWPTLTWSFRRRRNWRRN